MRPIYRYSELSTFTISWIIKEMIEGMQSLEISVAAFVSELLNFAVKSTSYCQNVSRARFLRGTFFICQKSISPAQICCWTQLTTTNRSRCRLWSLLCRPALIYATKHAQRIRSRRKIIKKASKMFVCVSKSCQH